LQRLNYRLWAWLGSGESAGAQQNSYSDLAEEAEAAEIYAWRDRAHASCSLLGLQLDHANGLVLENELHDQALLAS